MIEKAAEAVPIWTILSTAFGFLIGEVCGDHRRHSKCLQQANDELRNQPRQTTPDTESIHLALKHLRSVVNDAHHRIVTVSKSLKKRPS